MGVIEEKFKMRRSMKSKYAGGNLWSCFANDKANVFVQTSEIVNNTEYGMVATNISTNRLHRERAHMNCHGEGLWREKTASEIF